MEDLSSSYIYINYYFIIINIINIILLFKMLNKLNKFNINIKYSDINDIK